MSTLIRHICPPCCARPASGQAVAEATIPLMKSRRRIAAPQGSGPVRTMLWNDAITAGNYDLRNGVRLSFCAAANLGTDVRFGSKADIGEGASDVRFTPKSRHWGRCE